MKTALENSKLKINNSKTQVAEILNAENEVWALMTLALRLEETISQGDCGDRTGDFGEIYFRSGKGFQSFLPQPQNSDRKKTKLKRAVLIVAADIARRSLTAALNTMGIEVPERM